MTNDHRRFKEDRRVPLGDLGAEDARASTSLVGVRRQSRRTRNLSPLRVLRAVSQRLQQAASLGMDYLNDATRFFVYSGTMRPYSSKSRLGAKLTMNYHAVEKGLTLRQTRPGFGQPRIATMLADLRKYVGRYGWDDTAQVTLRVLQAYAAFNASHGNQVEHLENALSELTTHAKENSASLAGGSMVVTRGDMQVAARGSFPELVSSRHSIRQFSAQPVEMDLVREAVALAVRTPSVCNRQSWKVRVYEGDDKEKVLALQHGNRGFGHQADKVLLVTGDLQCFFGSHERNQVYIDGGMFAMTLIYALHFLGLGTCALNLSIGRKTDMALRRVAEIPPFETFIMMIAVGNIDETVPVACSTRHSVGRVLVSGIPQSDRPKRGRSADA